MEMLLLLKKLVTSESCRQRSSARRKNLANLKRDIIIARSRSSTTAEDELLVCVMFALADSKLISISRNLSQIYAKRWRCRSYKSNMKRKPLSRNRNCEVLSARLRQFCDENVYLCLIYTLADVNNSALLLGSNIFPQDSVLFLKSFRIYICPHFTLFVILVRHTFKHIQRQPVCNSWQITLLLYMLRQVILNKCRNKIKV